MSTPTLEKPTKNSAYTADEIADYLIFLASEKTIGEQGEIEGITHLKLHKMLYFVQAHFLVILGRPAFSEEIEAWEYGPVVPAVYEEYKDSKNQPLIPTNNETEISTIAEEDKPEVEKVWYAFGKYSAEYLVDITHLDGPWKDAYSKKPNSVITQKALEKHYKVSFRALEHHYHLVHS